MGIREIMVSAHAVNWCSGPAHRGSAFIQVHFSKDRSTPEVRSFACLFVGHAQRKF